MSDDLDDFFSEIAAVEEVPQPEPATVPAVEVPAVLTSMVASSSAFVPRVVPKALEVVVKSSHPVYPSGL